MFSQQCNQKRKICGYQFVAGLGQNVGPSFLILVAFTALFHSELLLK